MKGLLKNNVYAVLSNAKLFSAMMLVLGIFVVGIDHDAQIFIIGYMLLCGSDQAYGYCEKLFSKSNGLALHRNAACGNRGGTVHPVLWIPF